MEYVDLANTKWGILIESTKRFYWKEAHEQGKENSKAGRHHFGHSSSGRTGSYALVDEGGLTGSMALPAAAEGQPSYRELV